MKTNIKKSPLFWRELRRGLLLTVIVGIIFTACKKDEEKPVEEVNQTIADRLSKRWEYYAAKFETNPDTTYLDEGYDFVATFKKPNIYSFDLLYETYNEDSILVKKEYNYVKGTWEIQNSNILKIYSQSYTYTYAYDSLGNYVPVDSALTDNTHTQEILVLYDNKLTLHETLVVDDTTSMEVTYFYRKYSE